MLDSDELLELHTQFRAEMQNVDIAKKIAPKRDLVEFVRVRFWYEGVRKRSKLNTAYALEQHFEPESFRRRAANDKPSYPCKWKKYEIGLRTPQPRLLERVNSLLPGSLQELRHPLWDVLKLKPNRSTLSEIFLQRLNPEVLVVLFKHADDMEVPFERAKVTSAIITKLKKIANLDALAALVWLLYEALYNQNQKRGEDLTRSIYDILLMRSIWWEERKLAAPLLTLFTQRILSKGTPPHLVFEMSAQEIVDASAALNLMVHINQGSIRIGLSWHQRVSIMLKLLNGRRALPGLAPFDVKFAFAPIYVPDPNDVTTPKVLLDDLQSQEKRRQLAWDNILPDKTTLCPTVEMEPPHQTS
ncbi:hypothetical protein JFU47_07945 [Pseudomonas sp. TH39(2020)]|uniref:hypothetical protein n=1 Tax=Pseudomonas sp. TH39(2020) TaxID=2796349 RepID=UPI0019148020|nr:hypothetical protein [Pseudomonas sp. TH39(2020)]MBK5396641.1 hypothetical protein [Pseudomonas sp. TH39(2020)]